MLTPGSELAYLRGTRFYGDVTIGMIEPESEQGIFNAVVRDCVIGQRPYISSVTGELKNLRLGDDVRIESCGRIEVEPGTDFGVGTEVSVLDETGSRPVRIFPGLTAQMAWLMAHNPRWTEEVIVPLMDAERDKIAALPHIGDGVVVRDVKCMRNVHVAPWVHIEGASRLVNGSILNNAPCPSATIAFVGDDVDAEDFIIEDGRVECGTLLRHVYVGQGAEIGKLYSAHDSLFFANCALECGEACAVVAGPYTVSMHKSTLLIAGEYSFFNAGSGTNFSNHMYKLGPVHHGVMERGVKTASSAYVMWDGNIGAFSLVMGAHRTHPDTSLFPYSYIFADHKGRTLVAPGQMLKSCGLGRDELKWPKRDRRVKARLPKLDNIHFPVLSPLTVGRMIEAMEVLQKLTDKEPNADGLVGYRGLWLRPSAVRHALELYPLAIAAYVQTHQGSSQSAEFGGQWVDVMGQLMTEADIRDALAAESIEELRQRLNAAFARYDDNVAAWLSSVRTPALDALVAAHPEATAALLALQDADRSAYLASLR